MGHHSTGEHARRARRARRAHRASATASTASAIYLYGEGWNFGEVADDARFVQATQGQPGRHRHRLVLRPAARRGPRRRARSTRTRGSRASAPASAPTPTGRRSTARRTSSARTSCTRTDLVKLGPGRQPARLRVPSTRTGETVAGQRTSTTTASRRGTPRDPSEVVTYVDAHDNETLFDALHVQAAAGHVDGRPGADEHPVAVDRGAVAGRRRSGTPAPTCCARK